jgi:hypothetical protein
MNLLTIYLSDKKKTSNMRPLSYVVSIFSSQVWLQGFAS